MATIYRKMYPIPMPQNAEIIIRRGERLARWTSGKGQIRIAPVVDDKHVQFVSDCWYVRYRDADGGMRRESTGCRDKQAAEKVLANILAGVDKVKAGVMSREEMTASDELNTPIDRHVKQYLAQLAIKTIRGRKVSPKHVGHVREQLDRVIRECRFRRLRDITRQALQRWMNKLASQPRDADDPQSEPLAARTINMHRAAIVAFCGWCVSDGRLPSNPLAGLPKAEESEPARQRRPLSEDEIARLLKAARERPLLDALTVRRGKNKGKPLAKVGDEQRRALERAGRERALVYKFMMLTGLRRNEAASLTVGPCVWMTTPHTSRSRAGTPRAGKAQRCRCAATSPMTSASMLQAWRLVGLIAPCRPTAARWLAFRPTPCCSTSTGGTCCGRSISTSPPPASPNATPRAEQ